jgi:hypothetical protein
MESSSFFVEVLLYSSQAATTEFMKGVERSVFRERPPPLSKINRSDDVC